MLKFELGSDEAPLYFIILQRRSYLRFAKLIINCRSAKLVILKVSKMNSH